MMEKVDAVAKMRNEQTSTIHAFEQCCAAGVQPATPWGMTPLRKKIIALARKFDGAIMTEFQVMDLRGTIGSMDDTLTDEEVLMFLEHLASGREYDMLISATKPSKKLVKVNVDKDLKITVSPAPFSKS